MVASIVASPVSAAMAAAATAVPVPTFVSVDGQLTGLVIDGAGHAFAINSSYNRVDVVDLATDTLELPIPVGNQPDGFDLNANGTLLYVTNAASDDISVIDVATRHEVRRIALPTSDLSPRPVS
ncbi:MAG: hypothetical protein M3159_01660, partial [Actinomycetota bacterium]|nr:hypothetical protein [Actinomycetota bacterium]